MISIKNLHIHKLIKFITLPLYNYPPMDNDDQIHRHNNYKIHSV